jgi:hypothetical protein
MGPVTNPGHFCAALSLYLDKGGGMAGGADRVRRQFPERASVLVAEIEAMLQASRNLPAMWGHEALPLEDPCDRIDRFVAAEYPCVPPELRKTFVNVMSYELRK